MAFVFRVVTFSQHMAVWRTIPSCINGVSTSSGDDVIGEEGRGRFD